MSGRVCVYTHQVGRGREILREEKLKGYEKWEGSEQRKKTLKGSRLHPCKRQKQRGCQGRIQKEKKKGRGGGAGGRRKLDIVGLLPTVLSEIELSPLPAICVVI